MTTHAEALIARWFGQAGGELLVGGRRVGDILAEVGTPSFVYDLQVLERTSTRLTSWGSSSPVPTRSAPVPSSS
jgi:diaminopimelate decarboxylase